MKKILRTIQIGVIGYSLGYMFVTFLYCLPRILAEFSSMNVSRLAERFDFPLEIFAWGLFAICSGYSGADIGLGNKFKVKGNSGEFSKDRVLQVIVILILILAESTFFKFFFSQDFVLYSDYGKQVFHGIDLPLTEISTALVTTLVIYITGNQIIQNRSDNDEKNS